MDRNTHYIANNKLFQVVALRKESVDRNVRSYFLGSRVPVSLSARRAWIEIWKAEEKTYLDNVALRKESVDRNAEDWLNAGSLSRRSPQGERG